MFKKQVISFALLSPCTIFAAHKSIIMETTALNTAQQNILRILSHVNDEKTVSDIERLLTNYFAQKVDAALEDLIVNGKLSMDTISQWEKEHLRTPY
ncbi:MAG: hypothetical protein ACI3YC_00565 [Alloprevotella sp.]